MSCRRLALAPVVALVLCGSVGGSTALAAPSSSASDNATATAAAKKKKKKKTTVASLEKRVKKTEKNLAAARRQLKLVQRATAGLVSGLDTFAGANGSIEALLGGSALTDSLGPEFAKLQAILDKSLTDQAATNANALVAALGNPALKPQLETLLTQLFGVSPTAIGAAVSSALPSIQASLNQLVVREQPLLFAQVGSVTSGAVVGADLPDDVEPVSVSGSAVLNVTGASATPVKLLAGVRTDEADQPAAKAVLDSLEVEGSGVTLGGGTDFGGLHRALGGSGASVSLGRIPRSGALDPTHPTLVDIAQGPLTVTGTGSVIVRFTVRFTDDSVGD
ncbi:MAG: hypothetical protein JHC95_09805 [Solirubrobacteraceae bacterium]|nr:hypothetical protein [Solirubrobacteraceae bacterium]